MTFDNSGKPSRGLPYPLKNPQTFSIVEAVGTVTHLTPDVFPTDADEKINIVLNLSLNEFVALASSIDVGSDIAYGDDRNLIWWTWVRSFIGLAVTMSCDDVADCIESEIIEGNQTLIDILVTNNINTGTGGDTNRISGSITKFKDRNLAGTLENDSIKDLANCNLDVLWAGLRYGLVERADDDVRSVLESLAAISSVPDRLIEFVEIIPVVGDVVQATLDLATEAIPTLLTFFDSYSSLDHMDEYACGLFAIVCSECRYPTFQEVWDYNKSFGITSMPEMAAAVFQAVMDAVVGSSETASQIAYFTLMNFRLATLLLQATFNGKTGTNAVLRDVSLGEDFANDNWIENCDSCNESYVLWTWDFTTQGAGEFYADLANTTSKAVFEIGKGWRAVPHSGGKRFNVNMVFDPTWEVRAAAMKFSGTGGSDRTWYRRPTWSSTSGQQNASAGSSDAEWSGFWEGYASVTNYNEVGFYASTAIANDLWLEKVSILFNIGHSPAGNSVPTNDLTPYGSP